MKYLALVLLACAEGCIAFQQEPVTVWSAPRQVLRLDTEQITESSGLAASTLENGVLYTHNDSGDTARFFKVGIDGKLRGVYSLKKATATDWEDMASASGNLYLGDIGDNLKTRREIIVYRVREPRGSGGTIQTFDTIRLRYPGGPRDAETLMVSPARKLIYLVTKAPEGSEVFVAPDRPGSWSGALKLVGRAVPPSSFPGGKLVTGGAISPDGSTVVLRTYFAAYQWSYRDFPSGRAETVTLASERQGEAICFSKDGTRLYTSSEGTPFTVNALRRAGK